MRAAWLVVPLVLAFVPTPAAATTWTVTSTNFQWSPTPLNLDPGDAVTFQNGGGSHTLVSNDFDDCNMPCTVAFPTAGVFDYVCGIHASMKGRIVVGSPPSVTIGAPENGAPVWGIVAASGAATSTASTVLAVDVSLGNAPFSPASLSPIEGGVAWSASVDSRGLANGPATLRVQATDALGLQTEATRSVTIANPPSVDLVALSLTSTTALTGAPTLRLTMSNTGNAPSGTFTVESQYFYKGEWRTFSAVQASLDAKASTTLSYAWNDGKPHVGKYSVRALVDPANAIVETNEANNAATTTATWYSANAPPLDPLDP